MNFFYRLSIRRKVMLAILAGSLTTVGIGGLVLVLVEAGTYRNQALATVSALANIAGASSTGALAFNDAAAAERNLAALGEDAAVLAARLYSHAGAPLGTYSDPRRKFNLPNQPPPHGHEFTTGRLRYSAPVLLHGDRVGDLYIVMDMDIVHAKLWAYAGIVFLSMLVLAGLAVLVSYGLQRFVSAPVLELAEIARHITENKDFSVRARGGGTDEVGVLTNAFNLMLQAIQVREIDLEQNRYNLELAQKSGRIGSFNWFAATDRMECSDELFALFGVTRDNFQGRRQDWQNAIHPEDRARALHASRVAEKGDGHVSVEFRIVWPDKSIHWIVTRAKYFYGSDGATVRMAGVMIDISERKQFEAQLVDQAEALWRSNRELEQFAYVSSHDLQEPLRKVASYAELLSSKYHNKMGEEADRYIENVTDGVVRMRDLIHDLLAFSKLSRQEIPHESVPMDDLVKRIISDLEMAIREKKADVKAVTPMPVIHARRSQMQQVLQNLIGNALKFQAPGVAPMVEIGHEKRDREDVFSVRDNGIGLEEQYAEQIFKVFQRLHPRGHYPGTGIGLAICKKIVEQHGGKIWLRSAPGKGTTFFFSIPATPPA